MKLSEIINISGVSGLFKTVGNSKNSIIVESLADKKRMPVYSTQKVNSLENISVYLTDKEIPLSDVFRKIMEKEKKGPAIDHKSEDAVLVKYFTEVLPDYDKTRVHISDIRKMIMWYNILHKAEMLDIEEEKKAEGEEAKETLPADNSNKPQHQQHSQQQFGPKKPRTHAPTTQKQTVRKTGVA
jgi:hypothetical protein